MIMRPQSVPHSFMTRFTQASSKTKPLSKQPAMKDQIEKKGRSENEKRQKHDAHGADPFISRGQDETSCAEPRCVCSSNLVCVGGLLCAAEPVRAIKQPATARSNRLEAGRASVRQSGLNATGRRLQSQSPA